jgi:hypothetical protein
MTAKFYGDTQTLNIKQIHDVVDRIYDSMTKVTFENLDDNSIQQNDLSFDTFVKSLLRQKEIQDIVVLPIVPKRVRMRKSKRSTKSVDHTGSPIVESSFGAPITRKSAMKMSSIYDFGTNRDDESSVKIHFPASPKTAKNQVSDKNTNKYMPLIDEIEKDARRKIRCASYKAIPTSIVKEASSEPDEPVVVSSSSSNDDIDGIDPRCIHITTTEEEDDDKNDNEDDNSLQETHLDKKHLEDDAILAALNENSYVKSKLTRSLKPQHATKNSSNVISNNINLYSMVLETSETATSPASQSVQSTDLSSHMSSVMLRPVARVRVSQYHSQRI